MGGVRPRPLEIPNARSGNDESSSIMATSASRCVAGGVTRGYSDSKKKISPVRGRFGYEVRDQIK